MHVYVGGLRNDEQIFVSVATARRTEAQVHLCAMQFSTNYRYIFCTQEYVDSIKVPDGILDPLDVDALGSWIVDMAFLVYLCFETKNDFFILHGVTSAWSLKQVVTMFAARWHFMIGPTSFQSGQHTHGKLRGAFLIS